MSESRAFANFSNTSRALQSSAGQQQEGRTFQDTVDDAKNFEQQFLIGMAVHQKAKVGDNLVKLFKGSKKLKSATGLSEDDLANIAKGDFSGVTKKISSDLSKKLQKGISDLRDAKAQRDAKTTLSKIKQDVADRLSAERDAAKTASDDADAEVTRLRGLSQGKSSDLNETARGLRESADSDQAEADAATAARDTLSKTRPTADSTEDDVRLESNPEYDAAANDAIDKQRIADDSASRATEAENVASRQVALEAQQGDAALLSHRAASDLASKTSAAEEAEQAATEASGDTGVEALAGQAANVARLESKLTKVEDVSEAAAGESEADPLGLVVAALGAVAATVIGRKIKTHTEVDVSPPPIQSSYAATLGA